MDNETIAALVAGIVMLVIAPFAFRAANAARKQALRRWR